MKRDEERDYPEKRSKVPRRPKTTLKTSIQKVLAVYNTKLSSLIAILRVAGFAISELLAVLNAHITALYIADVMCRQIF